MGRLVDIDNISLDERRIGALPVVNHFPARLGPRSLLEKYVRADLRATLSYSASVLALLDSLVVERAAVYKIGDWASGRKASCSGS